MGVLLGMFIGIAGILGVLVFRSLTTFFHELGHAIPALMFTRQPVTVYVGSYGDISNSYQLNLGHIKIYFKWNLLDWKIGLCRHEGVDNFWQNLIILLGGPFASLIIAVPLIWLMATQSLTDGQITIIMIFVAAALIDLAVNLWPSASGFKLHDGGLAYSDGYIIILLLSRLSLSEEYLQMEKKYEEGKYDEVRQWCEEQISKAEKPPVQEYSLLIETQKAMGLYREALDTYKEFGNNGKLQLNDFKEIGELHVKVNEFMEALKYFNHCLYYNYSDADTLNKRAEVYIEMSNFEEAINDLNAAIHYQPGVAEMHLNRSLVKIKTGKLADALEDLTIAEQLTGDNPLLAYYYGLYHHEGRDMSRALNFFKKAKEQGVERHDLDYRIGILEDELK
ncbi:MAG: hypothetical protein DWQ02_23315 [Bacteroidetes bacterium]|nr:MAG: hypothetical protein DWQ02_23315 [Bacteroidota bacterium]